MSLSDNLKPWSIIEKRLDLAAEADLALAFYNPISRARPWQLGRALEIVARHRVPQTPVVLGRAGVDQGGTDPRQLTQWATITGTPPSRWLLKISATSASVTLRYITASG